MKNIIYSVYTFVKNLYIYYFYRTIDCFEKVTELTLGEEYVEAFWARWYLAIFFYTNLYYVIKKAVCDKYDTLKLEYIWKIKRSAHPIIKKLAEYLSKYDWFNNNIIKF